jgi:hypothetical protein
MRFMMLIKSDSKAEAGILPDPKLVTEMGKLNEEMMKAGALLSGEGLRPSSQGTRVRLSGGGSAGTFTVIDGPFAETNDLIAGFWLIQTKSKEEAIEWAKRVPGPEGEIEIRALFEVSDLPVDPSEKPDGWREQEVRFREAVDRAPESAPGSPTPPARKPGTTRFIVMLKANERTESDALPSPETLTAMGALMTELASSGALLSADGLKPTSKGARIKRAGSRRTVTDGPFTETKEIIAGYSMIQVKSMDEAIDFAKRWLPIHLQGAEVAAGEIEIRPLFERSDLPA